MFGIGMTELLLILALALIVIGPQRLPGIARALGKMFAEFKRTTDELRYSITEENRAAETRDRLIKEGKIQPPSSVPAPFQQEDGEPVQEVTPQEDVEDKGEEAKHD